MAWIKVDSELARKLEILRLARTLEVSVAEAAGLCVIFWGWADGQTVDGHLEHCDRSTIDNVVGRAGFAAALESVRWLAEERGCLVIPHFDRHNGASAKRRALAAARQSKFRKNSW